ncbi:MAG: CDP-diacylglycerol--serine O-phosphatidyltransferase [Halothiobacillaceae bacterium]|nr:CDP-diacylglycerol--serine O-phosphatidyltransferase [Halothiobacillaceae bacterium]
MSEMPDLDAQRPARPRRRAIYLLPNLFTTAALFAGFYAIIAALSGRFEAAAVAVFVAMILDGLDGRVARLTNTQSEFGVQYDSLSDVISFGMAPALVMYQWSLVHLAGEFSFGGKLAWLAAFVYVAGAALRLARFNVQVHVVDKRFFIGLASPAAAALMMGMVWMGVDENVPGRELMLLSLVVTLAAGLLMVSNFPYYSFKALDLRRSVPFIVVLALVLFFVIAASDPPKVLFGFFLLYALSGPLVGLLRWRRRRRREAA